jgi:hypothetical protein
MYKCNVYVLKHPLHTEYRASPTYFACHSSDAFVAKDAKAGMAGDLSPKRRTGFLNTLCLHYL